MYYFLESMLSSKSRKELDFYDMSNGHVTSMNEENNVTAVNAPVQQVPVDYPMKLPVIREYVTVCQSEDHHLIMENPLMQIHSTHFTSHPRAPVTIDVNGCVTNGNMQMPPERKEATYMIASQ